MVISGVRSSVGTAFAHAEAEVRELVRRRGLDPVQDRSVMRLLIDEVAVDYDERALTSTLPPLPDLRVAARAVYDAVAGFGPLQRHLDDPGVEALWINERLTHRCRGPRVVKRCTALRAWRPQADSVETTPPGESGFL